MSIENFNDYFVIDLLGHLYITRIVVSLGEEEIVQVRFGIFIEKKRQTFSGMSLFRIFTAPV